MPTRSTVISKGNLFEGDVLVMKGHYGLEIEYRTVLGVCGDVVFLETKKDEGVCVAWTHKKITDGLWYLLLPEPPKEVTLTREQADRILEISRQIKILW